MEQEQKANNVRNVGIKKVLYIRMVVLPVNLVATQNVVNIFVWYIFKKPEHHCFGFFILTKAPATFEDHIAEKQKTA